MAGLAVKHIWQRRSQHVPILQDGMFSVSQELNACGKTATFRVKLSERLLWSDFYSRIAAYPVTEICDLLSPKWPLQSRDRQAAMWRTFRQSELWTQP